MSLIWGIGALVYALYFILSITNPVWAIGLFIMDSIGHLLTVHPYGYRFKINLMLFVYAVSLLGWHFIRGKIAFKVNAVFYALASLLFIIFISSVASDSRVTSLNNFLVLLKSALPFLFFMGFVHERKSRHIILISAVLPITLWSCYYAIYAIAHGFSLLPDMGIPFGGISGNNELAFACLVCIPVMLYLLKNLALPRVASVFLLFALFMVVLTCVFSFSRAAILGLALFAFFIVLKTTKVRKWMPIPVLVFAGLLLFKTDFSERYLIFFSPDRITRDGSFNERVMLLKTGFSIAGDHLILGRGEGAWEVEAGKRIGQIKGLHNGILKLLIENGLLALMAYLILMWLVYKNALSYRTTYPAFAVIYLFYFLLFLHWPLNILYLTIFLAFNDKAQSDTPEQLISANVKC